MKNSVLIIALFILSFKAQSQAVLEHTYPFSANLGVAKLTNYGWIYYYLEPSIVKKLSIYSSNHVFIKSFTLPVPTGYTFTGLTNVSDELFNLDNKIEALFSYYKVSGSNVDYQSAIYNEDGVQKQLFQNQYAYYITNLDGDFKLISYSYADSISYVYSLPGTMVSTPNIINQEEFYTIYPNPTNDVVKIDYTSSAREIYIHSSDGKVVMNIQVNGTGHALISTATLSNGVYFLSIITSSGKKSGGKLIVDHN